MYDEEAIFQDADIEQAAYEAEGRAFSLRTHQSALLSREGNFDAAARKCPHGGGYQLSSPAAEDEGDPFAGEDGVRCCDCGSRLTAFAWDGGDVMVPCEWLPERLRDGKAVQN